MRIKFNSVQKADPDAALSSLMRSQKLMVGRAVIFVERNSIAPRLSLPAAGPSRPARRKRR